MNLEELLGIAWKERMLVNSEHLLHSDKRASLHASLLSNCSPNAFGLILIDGKVTDQSIIDIDSITKSANQVELEIKVKNSFCAICKNKKMLIVTRSNSEISNIFKTTYRSSDKSQIICVASGNQAQDDRKFKGELGDSLNLNRQVTEFVVIPPEDCLHNIATLDSAIIPIASINTDNTLVNDYIPPVVQMDIATIFNHKVLSEISSNYDTLMKTVERINENVSLYNSNEVGETLKIKLSDLNVLRMILVSNTGLINDLSRISPRDLHCNITLPMAKWSNNFASRPHSEGNQTVSNELFAVSVDLMDISFDQINIGCSELLNGFSSLLSNLITELSVIG